MSLGSYHLELGELDEARDCYERAESITRSAMLLRPHRVVTAYLGVLAIDEGDFVEGEARLRWAAARAGAAGDLRVEGVLEGFRAAALALLDRRSEARAAFDRARALLVDNPFFSAVVDLHRAHLDLADARAALARGDRALSASYVHGARMRIELAGAPGDETSGAAAGDKRSLLERSDDARIAVRILERAMRPLLASA
jgi:tetratricopeptide (TPR) repeat protein